MLSVSTSGWSVGLILQRKTAVQNSACSQQRDSDTRAIGAQIARHSPYRLSYDSDRDDFQSVEDSVRQAVSPAADAEREQCQRDR